MADYEKVEIVRDSETEAPSLEQQAQEMEQRLGEPQAPQEGQVEQVAEERPEWLPEKFDSPEALAAAYAALQSEYSRSRTGEEVEEQPQGQFISAESMDPYTVEFEQTGDISETSRQAISEMGLPRDMVDRYVEGMKAQTAMELQEVYSSVGGPEAYEQMVNWAADNIPPEEIEAFNNVVMQGDENAVRFAVNSLKSRWESQGGRPEPQSLIQGDTGYAQSSERFESLTQLTTAMKDPRYKTDPAYRRLVEAKLGQSSIL